MDKGKGRKSAKVVNRRMVGFTQHDENGIERLLKKHSYLRGNVSALLSLLIWEACADDFITEQETDSDVQD